MTCFTSDPDVFFTSPKRAPATGDKEDRRFRQKRRFSVFLAYFRQIRAGYAYPASGSNEDIRVELYHY